MRLALYKKLRVFAIIYQDKINFLVESVASLHHYCLSFVVNGPAHPTQRLADFWFTLNVRGGGGYRTRVPLAPSLFPSWDTNNLIHFWKIQIQSGKGKTRHSSSMTENLGSWYKRPASSLKLEKSTNFNTFRAILFSYLKKKIPSQTRIKLSYDVSSIKICEKTAGLLKLLDIFYTTSR